MPSLPEITTLPSLPAESRAKVLDLLFEPSVPLHTLSLPLTSPTSIEAFKTYDDLIIAVGLQLTDLAESTSSSDTEWLESILAAHPRLGEKKVDSELSRMEQAKMDAASKKEGGGGDDGKAKEGEILKGLNEEYEKAFPGLRYVYVLSRLSLFNDMHHFYNELIDLRSVFVNGRSRPVIFEDMKRRIERGDIKAERSEAIKVIFPLLALHD
jgi:2-oxo-4-hydroxy-4-carboxy--5-ureidoimidazoline (OHCU) decarboxylase